MLLFIAVLTPRVYDKKVTISLRKEEHGKT